ncbi:MAG: nucleoside phosphatase family-domain-containing protein [Monoraphidium minutum]|nr:MAG: nucleoside phosphatase family-domain-containing protein [Monoraphidium minutum]
MLGSRQGLLLPLSRPPSRMFRRRESLQDRVWRLRGLLFIGALVLLILSLTRSAARSSSTAVKAARAPPERQRARAELRDAAAAPGSGSAPGSGGGEDTIYSIVIDAGSTGSRIHVMQFRRDAAAAPPLQLSDTKFESLKPGLSSYRDDPRGAAESLKPLLETAMAAVPQERRAATALTLKATAGLRLLPGSKADEILKAVDAFLQEYPFKIKADGVGIMDGAHEGAYAWLTLNYLLGKLGGGPDATVAAIDLGGGSVQEAFALPDEEVAAAPKGYVIAVSAGGRQFHVYVHSYLGYGLMAARAKVIESGADNATDPASASGHHPCFAKGTKLKYTYGDKEYPVGEVVEAGDFRRCAAAALKALEHDKGCGHPQSACSFSGAWRGKPGGMKRVYYVSSYFFDRAVEAGIIPDKGAINFGTTPKEFARRAAGVCGKDPAAVASELSIDAEAARFLCLDLSFCHTVLTQGFDLPETSHLTLVKRVEYQGKVVDASWALGAALDELSAAAQPAAAGAGAPAPRRRALWEGSRARRRGVRRRVRL